MNIRHPLYKIDHRYNSKIPDIVSIRSRSHHQPTELSYHCQINNILDQWRQLQEEKKQYQLQQQQQQQQKEQRRLLWKSEPKEYDEFDLIMEEDHANQLKELEREEEEEQYKRMEQTIEEQLALDDYNEQWNEFEENYIKQLEEQEANQVKIFLKIERKNIHLHTWTQKENLHLHNQIKTNKLIELLETYWKAKKYYVQPSK